MIRSTWILVSVVVLWGAGEIVFAAELDADQSYAYAMRAAAAGDLNVALVHFHKAKRAGMHSSALFYNLGVNYYKLGYFSSAYYAFYELYKNNELSDLAQYNLALVSLKMDRPDLAKQWLYNAIRVSQNASVKNLSERMLSTLESKPIVPVVQNEQVKPEKIPFFRRHVFFLGIDSSYGSDSNVASVASQSNSEAVLQSGLELAPSQSEDKYSQNSATGTYFRRLERHEFVISVLSYLRQYRQKDNYDFFSVGGDVRYNRRFSRFGVALGGRFERHTLGDVAFEEISSIETGLFRENTNSRFGISYKYTTIDNVDELYKFLAGNRQDVRLQLDGARGRHRYGWSYQYEVNDHLYANEISHSYTPTQSTLAGYYGYAFYKLSYLLFLNVNQSVFSGEDTAVKLPENSGKREDIQYVMTNRIAYDFNKYWKMYFQISITKNDSSLKPYFLQKQDMSAGLSWQFQ